VTGCHLGSGGSDHVIRSGFRTRPSDGGRRA
jgi:hypothetical protein